MRVKTSVPFEAQETFSILRAGVFIATPPLPGHLARVVGRRPRGHQRLADCPLKTTGASPLPPRPQIGTPAPPLASSEAAEYEPHPRTPAASERPLCVGRSRPRAPRPGKAPPRGTKEAARAPHSPARSGAAGVLPGRACAAPEPRPELPPVRVPQPRGR